MTTSAQSATEKNQLLAALERSQKRWLDVLVSVPESACGVKLNEGCWSILQIAEHVGLVEQRMLRAIERAPEKASEPNYAADQKIATAVATRTAKLKAPEMVLPQGRWFSTTECADQFAKDRTKTLEYVRSAANLRARSFMHPILGEIDCYQAVLVMAGHPERHALQVEEIKASAAYATVAGQ